MAKKKKQKRRDSHESNESSLRESRESRGESHKFSESSLRESRSDSWQSTKSKKRKSNGKSHKSNAEFRNTQKGKRGFRRIYNAFFYSLHGLKAAFCEEEAFRQILIVSAILIPLGAYLGESFAEKVLLILPCVLAIIAELTNSAIENAIDFAGLEIHPFAKKAKDMGSAIQLVACAFMAFVWIYYLILILL